MCPPPSTTDYTLFNISSNTYGKPKKKKKQTGKILTYESVIFPLIFAMVTKWSTPRLCFKSKYLLNTKFIQPIDMTQYTKYYTFVFLLSEIKYHIGLCQHSYLVQTPHMIFQKQNYSV